MRRLLWLGVLLGAAPLFSESSLVDPRVENGQFHWFLLTETREGVRKVLGQPKDVTEFPADFESWQYQIGEEGEGDYSHQLVFRKSTGQLISITRNYEPGRLVDQWFPPNETNVHYYPDKQNPQYSLRLRRLPGDRVLMEMGTSKAGQTAEQIVLMREAEIRFFYPWLDEQLHPGHPAR